MDGKEPFLICYSCVICSEYPFNDPALRLQKRGKKKKRKEKENFFKTLSVFCRVHTIEVSKEKFTMLRT